MSRKRLVFTVGGTVACAFGIGFVMQKGESGPHPLKPVQIEQAALSSTAMANETPLDLQGITLTSALPDFSGASADRKAELAALDTATSGEAPRPPSDPETPRLGCDLDVAATPAAMASVVLDVRASCSRNERVTVHHSGMMFTETTDDSGLLSVTIPVLSQKAVFIVAFTGGQGAVATAEVPALENFERVAVQWSGDNGFQMHAREFGAGYGEQGHIWSGVDQLGAPSGSGFVTRLGDDQTLAPQLAEVYTFPSGMTDRGGIVELSVEAEVTQANCGRDIAAQSLELRGNDALRTRDLVLSMPNCTTIGDFLVLNNLLDDLKIAAN